MFDIQIKNKSGQVINKIGDVVTFNKAIELKKGQSIGIDISVEKGEFVFTSVRDVGASDFWKERVSVNGSLVTITAVSDHLTVMKGSF
ncbi:hypothetical protein [Wohlfahrtiimonas chitiniclastica]|uniref:hypothetical protein n=1 Tax=Wohlfahrtiimonas chitiniclastica TaxID=400946 RepID=UPI000B98EF94|nr:hypothetical protein [Wohlfahrtiimonas chitiniclastica]MBS7837197.1 hypothetical protein [Wohlfahrtiimonas chitiniclastica]OYQ76067.1 hypothetical protein B9T18_01550 [Wohlfahrtiimonas chitiniclastica]